MLVISIFIIMFTNTLNKQQKHINLIFINRIIIISLLLYIFLNFHQLTLPLISIFSSKVSLSLSILLLIIKESLLLNSNKTTLTPTVCNKRLKTIDNWLAHLYEWLIVATRTTSCYDCWLAELASCCYYLELCLYSSFCPCSYLCTQNP